MKPQTIQSTSKVIKLQMALSFLMVVIGTLGAASLYSIDKPTGIFPSVVIVGVIWHVWMRISQWWNHG